MEDGEKHDAAIHDAILDEGDEAAATSGTKQLMIELGLTEEEALALLPGHEEEKAALVFAKLRPLEPTSEWAKRALSLESSSRNHMLRRQDGEKYYGENPGERDELGRFGPGGGSGGGAEGSKPAGSGAGEGRAGKSPVAFDKRSPSDAERGRGTVAVYAPKDSAALSQAGITPLTYHELSSAGAGRFHDAIVGAKNGKYGAAVTAYPQQDYAGMRTFLAEDGKAGFALKGDDIVSVFKDPGSEAKKFATTALELATQQGGSRLDAFDTALPEIYSQSGFRAVGRISWDDNYAPDGWSKETFRGFNGGQPDVVFMVHDPANAGMYRAGDGARVADYDAGIAAQRDALSQLRKFIALPRAREDVERWYKQLQKFDPDQPRDETGKWTSDGGGSLGGGEPQGATPKVTTAKDVSKLAPSRVEEAVASIPKAHAEALKNIPVHIVKSTDDISSRMLSSSVQAQGLFQTLGDKPLAIYVAETVPYKHDGERFDLTITDMERTAVHELGHAYDHHNGWGLSKDIRGLAEKGLTRMTESEANDAARYFVTPKEMFAELYAVAYTPMSVTEREGQEGSIKYFGGSMSRKRAKEVFAEALVKVK